MGIPVVLISEFLQLICFCFVLDFSVRVYVRLSVTKS